MDAVDAQAVATAASELSRNILKFAGSGEIFLKKVQCEHSRGIVLTARDRGPGIADIDAAMADHFSSSGTLGLGLPGVRRMMHEFHIESEPGKSTTVACLKWNVPPRNGSRHLLTQSMGGENKCDEPGQAHSDTYEYASYGRPFTGEYVSGDLAIVECRDDLLFLAVVDGLGHGPDAHKVSLRIREFLVAHWCEDVAGTMRRLHESLRGSIGAVAGMAVLDQGTGDVRYCGVGNTSYRLFGDRDLRVVSTAGSLGHQIRSPQTQTHRLGNDDIIVMYSDGIKDRFDQREYPQLRHQSVDTIARTIVERFGKSHDDAICLVVRKKSD